MILLGASYPGRTLEQHDMFFSIAGSLEEMIPAMQAYWPEAGSKLHIDAWRRVTVVDNFTVQVVPRTSTPLKHAERLFFLNLGGYKQDEFDEYHYRMIIAAADKGAAIQAAKQTAFYKHTGFKGAESHIDDRFGVDVDDIYEINDILPANIREKYRVELTPGNNSIPDEFHLGYFKLNKLQGLS